MSEDAQLQLFIAALLSAVAFAALLSQRVLQVALGSLPSWEPPHGSLAQSPLRFL
jgi:hypothetical protein